MDSDNQRLPSFKSPRDLTLSNIRLPTGPSSARGRRAVAPNIPPKKDKNAPATTDKTKKSEPRDRPGPSSERGGGRGRGERGRGGRGRGRGKPEFIQSEGAIFADGVGDSTNKGHYRAPTVGGGQRAGGSSTGVPRKTAINNTELIDTIKNQSLKNIINNSKFISDLEQADEDGLERTIHLPLSSCLARININDDVKEKDMFMPKKKRTGVQTFSQTFSSLPPDGSFVLIQLPENLPVYNHPDKDDKDGKKELTKSISTLPEGLVASFELLSTGESRIVMGDTQFELVTGTRPAFFQELLLDEDDGFTSLGPVMYKYVGIPNVDTLLDLNV